MPKTLWTPGGMHALEEKDVVPLTHREVIMLSELHEFAFNHKLRIICCKCDNQITGQNNDSSKVLSVQCQCREFRFDGR